MKKIKNTSLLLLSGILIAGTPLYAEVLCKNKKSGAVASRAKSCQKTETLITNISQSIKSTKGTAGDTTGVDLSVTRLNGTNGTLNTTGLNVSVIGDTGGDSTNVGLMVDALGADTNYSAIFRGGNVGIGVSDPDEKLELSGRLHLNQTSSPSTVTDKLYNVGGNLYWNGEQISTGTQNQGTITGVTAGSGLTGGGTSGAVTLSVDSGTSANNIVQLNSSAQLPAVSGENLTNLSAASISSGTLSDSRLSGNVSLLGSSIGLSSEVAGTLPVTNGGTGAATLSDLITLGSHTSGSYVASVATGTGLSGGAAGSEGATLTLSLDQASTPTWTGSHSFLSSMNIGTSTASSEILHINGRMDLEPSTVPSTTTGKLYNVGGDLFFNGVNLSTGAAGGDITGVTNGTGLTGGGTSGDVTLAVDAGTTANKIVQLNGSAQLPAVSGVNLTALNASSLSTGTVPDGRLSANVSLLGSSIGLASSEVSGTLPVANGGTGTTTLNNLISLGSHTVGNYVDSVVAGTGVTIGSTAPEGDVVTVSVNQATGYTWTNTHTFSGVSTDITTGSNQDFAIIPNGTGKVGVGTSLPTAMLDTTLTSTSSSGSTQTGIASNVTDTGTVTSGTDTTIGSDINVVRTGASGGTINTTGLDVSVTGDTGGTSTATGLTVNVSGADTNYSGVFTGGKFGVGTSSPTANFETQFSSSSTTAASEFGNKFVVDDSGVVSSGSDSTTGMSLSVSRTGASGGTISTTGLDIAVLGDSGGTSQTTGLNVSVSSADKNVAAAFSGGSVSVGGSTAITNSNIPSGSLVVDNGALCIDNGGDNCADATRNAGTIYAANTTVSSVDVAEEFPIEPGDATEAGDIVIANTKKALKCVGFAINNTGEKVCSAEEEGYVPFVTRTSGSLKESHKILGVVSTKPGVTLGGFGQEELISYKKVPLALVGRVPVKVSLENGALEVGDRIAASSIPGTGRKAHDGEASIGIALEPTTGDVNIQKVLVLIK